MFPRLRIRAVGLVPLAVSLVFGGCDTKPHGANSIAFVGPTFPLPAVRISPQALIPLPVTSFGCPFVQPFTTEFDLIVDGRGSGDVFVNQVAFRFVDGTSFGSSLLFSAGDLRARFGQTTVLAGSTRLFRFAPQFGCGSFRPRSLLTDIVLIDRLGARQQMSLSAPIR